MSADTPVNRLLGMELLSGGDGESTVRLPPRPELLQEEGVIHGGILTTLADTAAVHALYAELPPGRAMTSIELKVNFLKPAVGDGGPLLARATVVQRGRRVGVCRVDVTQEERLVASGLFTYLFFDREPPSSLAAK